MVEVHRYSRDFSLTKKTPPVESLVVSKKNGTGRISRHKCVVPGLSIGLTTLHRKYSSLTQWTPFDCRKKNTKTHARSTLKKPMVFESFGFFWCAWNCCLFLVAHCPDSLMASQRKPPRNAALRRNKALIWGLPSHWFPLRRILNLHFWGGFQLGVPGGLENPPLNLNLSNEKRDPHGCLGVFW